MFEITPNLNKKNKDPLYVQLYEYIKHEIQIGSFSSGEKLPSKRKLSTHLGISLNTVDGAYQQLIAEGYVESRIRKGLFVSHLEEEVLMFNQTFNQNVKPQLKTKPNVKIDFNHGKVDLDAFPYATWRKSMSNACYEENLNLSGEPEGELRLREEIAKYLFQSRGVRCAPGQIVMGAGTQYMMGLLTLILSGEIKFAMEDPGFYRIKNVLQDRKVSLSFIPLDEDGIKMSQLRNSKARVVYVTPSHQFPCGSIMPISRRLELLKWAEETNSYIIEDDYDGEFRHNGKPIPSLQGLDGNGRVIYLGTFSKSFIPSIRVSYMILPRDLFVLYHEKFIGYKQTVSRHIQETLYQFMNKGYWERHLNKMRLIYKNKNRVLLKAIEQHLANHVSIIGEKSGLHILLKIESHLSEAELVQAAEKVGVKVYPTSIYYANERSETQPTILLGYGGLTEVAIHEGIQLLKTAWFPEKV